MKQVLNVGIGGRPFIIEEDAYDRLENYLATFRNRTDMGYQTKEVMDELEARIAEIFSENLSCEQEVVTCAMVDNVIARLGMPDGSEADNLEGKSRHRAPGRSERKIYRDIDHNIIGGVCSGLAYYTDIDVVIWRIVFACLLIFGSFGFWIYVIMWIVIPAARTGVEKCDMMGIPVTAENIRKVYDNKKR